jgi:hypothetical protein
MPKRDLFEVRWAPEAQEQNAPSELDLEIAGEPFEVADLPAWIMMISRFLFLHLIAVVRYNIFWTYDLDMQNRINFYYHILMNSEMFDLEMESFKISTEMRRVG